MDRILIPIPAYCDLRFSLTGLLFRRALQLEKARLLDQRKSEVAALGAIEEQQRQRYEAAEVFFGDRKALLEEQLAVERKERDIASKARLLELRKVVGDLREQHAKELASSRDKLWERERRFEFLEEHSLRKLFDEQVYGNASARRSSARRRRKKKALARAYKQQAPGSSRAASAGAKRKGGAQGKRSPKRAGQQRRRRNNGGRAQRA